MTAQLIQGVRNPVKVAGTAVERDKFCLLYTSDAADDLLCVDLGGRRIIKKKTTVIHRVQSVAGFTDRKARVNDVIIQMIHSQT